MTVLWVGWMVIKALTQTNGHVLNSHLAGVSTPLSVGIIAAIGFATYGNEPDLFRYAKPSWKAVVPPAGRRPSDRADPLPARRLDPRRPHPQRRLRPGFNEAVSFSLFGLAILAFILATATQVAVNDANYYESLNAGQNLFGGWSKWRRVYTCALIAAGGGFMAWWVPQSLDHFFRIATWLAVSVPTATVIMYADQLVLPKLLKIDRRMDTVPAWNQVARGNWPGIAALLDRDRFRRVGQRGAALAGRHPLTRIGHRPVRGVAARRRPLHRPSGPSGTDAVGHKGARLPVDRPRP